MDLLIMCLEFFKTGLLSVGGGLATLPFLYEMADRYPWFSARQISDMIAVSESTPGPMGVNMATYLGYSAFGIPGAILATFSLVLPSIIVILIVAHFLEKFQENRYVQYVLYGIRPASVGLISAAAFSIFKLAFDLELTGGFSGFMNWKAAGTGVFVAVLYYFRKKWHPLVFILIGAAAGIVLSL